MHGRFAFANQSPAILAQASHTLRGGDLSQFVGRIAMQNQGTNLVADSHDFEHTLSSAITRALAIPTASSAIQHFGNEIAELGAKWFRFGFGNFLFALLTNQPHQTLSDHDFER